MTGSHIQMDLLINFDKELFRLLNSFHNEPLDFMMFWVTNKFIWIPLYAFLIVFIIRKFGHQSVVILLSICILILLVDQTTSSLMKPYFARLRPCHDDSMSSLVHLVTTCGGQYSFVSGHAANTFSLATFIYLIFRTQYWGLLFAWAGIVSYSRIYVGVHYPFDVVAGAVYGAVVGIIIFKLNEWISYRIFKPL